MLNEKYLNNNKTFITMKDYFINNGGYGNLKNLNGMLKSSIEY